MRAEQIPILKRIMTNSFWMGFETAILVVAVIALVLGALRGEYGPIKKAFEGIEHEPSRLASSDVQPDEQPQFGDR